MKKYMRALIICLLCLFSHFSLVANHPSTSLSFSSIVQDASSFLSVDQHNYHNFLNSHSKVKQTKVSIKQKR